MERLKLLLHLRSRLFRPRAVKSMCVETHPKNHRPPRLWSGPVVPARLFFLHHPSPTTRHTFSLPRDRSSTSKDPAYCPAASGLGQHELTRLSDPIPVELATDSIAK
jgi:hypothetical protein